MGFVFHHQMLSSNLLYFVIEHLSRCLMLWQNSGKKSHYKRTVRENGPLWADDNFCQRFHKINIQFVSTCSILKTENGPQLKGSANTSWKCTTTVLLRVISSGGEIRETCEISQVQIINSQSKLQKTCFYLDLQICLTKMMPRDNFWDKIWLFSDGLNMSNFSNASTC